MKGEGAVAQLAARYRIHPSQIQAWKKALTDGAAGVFGNGPDQKASSDAALIARLYQEVGQLKVDGISCRRGPVHFTSTVRKQQLLSRGPSPNQSTTLM